MKKLGMKENEKKFVKDWHFYHGRGKWLFIAAYGSLLGAIAHLLFSIVKFLVTQTIDFVQFKQYFFTQKFLVEWIVYTFFLGIFIGYLVWFTSEKYYIQLMHRENEDLEGL